MVAALSANALTVTVEDFRNGNVPPGYVDVSGEYTDADVIKVSEAPFVDYLIPANSGSPSVIATKEGAAFLSEENSTVDGLDGTNNLIDPDRYQVVFEWTDGDPLPFAEDFYGVSWGGWSASESRSLTTRVDLASEAPITVFHWFNDGWDYTNHNELDGHILTVTHYSSDGTEIATWSDSFMSGGAENIFGDHRQFYASIIEVTRNAEGDYLIIENIGANIGYKGTAVAILEDEEPVEPTEWAGFDIGADGWVDTGDFMGMVYPIQDYVYVANLQGWVYLPESHVSAEGAWTFVIR